MSIETRLTRLEASWHEAAPVGVELFPALDKAALVESILAQLSPDRLQALERHLQTADLASLSEPEFNAWLTEFLKEPHEHRNTLTAA